MDLLCSQPDLQCIQKHTQACKEEQQRAIESAEIFPILPVDAMVVHFPQENGGQRIQSRQPHLAVVISRRNDVVVVDEARAICAEVTPSSPCHMPGNEFEILSLRNSEIALVLDQLRIGPQESCCCLANFVAGLVTFRVRVKKQVSTPEVVRQQIGW